MNAHRGNVFILDVNSFGLDPMAKVLEAARTRRDSCLTTFIC